MSNRRMARESALQSLYYADSLKDMDIDDVLDYAGRMNSAGRYFIMLPKKTEVKSPICG